MSDSSNSDPKRELLRHTLATVAYRGGKALRNAPAEFGEFHASEGVRTPGQILAHVGDLFEWALSLAKGERSWQDSKPQPWDQEVARFYAALAKLDAYLASGETLRTSAEKLFQGPVADALTHVGQITILRRMAGAAVKGENYFAAEVTVGRVGAEQATPKREF
jgi:hypothetical protein